MSYPTIFHLVSDLSEKLGVRFVIIGGFAVSFYKVSRHTADADFLITQEDFKKIEPFLKKSGCKIEYSQKVFARATSMGEIYMIDADFMFVDEDTLGKIIKDAKKTKIAEKTFLVPSLNNIIALKLHALKYNFEYRENKDMADIVELIKINNFDFKNKSFKSLCLKYGTPKIYGKLMERLT